MLILAALLLPSRVAGAPDYRMGVRRRVLSFELIACSTPFPAVRCACSTLLIAQQFETFFLPTAVRVLVRRSPGLALMIAGRDH